MAENETTGRQGKRMKTPIRNYTELAVSPVTRQKIQDVENALQRLGASYVLSLGLPGQGTTLVLTNSAGDTMRHKDPNAAAIPVVARLLHDAVDLHRSAYDQI